MAAFGKPGTNSIGGFASDYTRQYILEAKVRQTPVEWKDPKDIATQFSNKVLIDTDRLGIAEAIFWCVENIPNRNHYDSVYFYALPNGEYMRMFSFSKPSDAMAFKLRWT